MKLEPYEIITAVHMERGGAQRPCLLLEGEADKRAILGVNVVDVKTIVMKTDGRKTLLEALSCAREKGVLGVMGIADTDLDRVLGCMPGALDVVWTGQNDMEMEMFCSGAFDQLITELLGPDGRDRFLRRSGATSVRSGLLDAADQLGKLRLLNRRHGQKSVSDMVERGLEDGWIDGAALKVAWDRGLEWLASVVGCGRREIMIKAKSIPEASQGAFARGHDASKLLAVCVQHHGDPRDVLQELQGEKLNKAGELVEGKLRCCFQREHFMETAVYEGMQAWQRLFPAYRLLRVIA